MATRHGQNGDASSAELPTVVPFSLSHLTRLSWELGSRVVDDEESTRHSEWEHADSPRVLSVFRATSDTVVLRMRTPAGRERFYGAARMDLDAALPGLRASSEWEQVK